MRLHADAVPENGASGVGTRRINGDDADGVALFAKLLRQLIHERALTRAGRSGDADG